MLIHHILHKQIFSMITNPRISVFGNPIFPLSKQFNCNVISTIHAMINFLNYQAVPNNVFQPKSNIYKIYIRILTENIGMLLLSECHSKLDFLKSNDTTWTIFKSNIYKKKNVEEIFQRRQWVYVGMLVLFQCHCKQDFLQWKDMNKIDFILQPKTFS